MAMTGIGAFLRAIFGGGRNPIVETVEAFRPNAEAADARASAIRSQAMQAAAGEVGSGRGWFGGFVDALNRLPRPALAFGTLALFAYAMTDPVGFGIRMQGLALVPEPLWWLLGAIVSFYFGARELHYRREQAVAAVGAPAVREVVENIERLRELRSDSPGVASVDGDAEAEIETAKPDANRAVDDFKDKLGTDRP